MYKVERTVLKQPLRYVFNKQYLPTLQPVLKFTSNKCPSVIIDNILFVLMTYFICEQRPPAFNSNTTIWCPLGWCLKFGLTV